MNVIFIAGLFPKELKNEIEANSKGVIQNAADALQWSLVKGFDYYFETKIINLPYINSFPKFYKKISVPSFKFEHRPGAKDINLGFINLPIVKHFIKYIKTKNELLKTIQNLDNDTKIIIYSVHSPFLKAATDLKKRYPNIKICLIVTDLPQYMSHKASLIYKLLKYLDSIIINKAIKKIDSFVLLSDYMAEALNIPGEKPWVRIEGIFDPINLNNSYRKTSETINILYTGTLASRNGIQNLLKSFSNISKPNYRLWICGEGDTKEEIIRQAKQDPRITFFGQISREKVLQLQKEATVLVNPRTSQGKFTKYSFPSKTMEYLASGTPCIIHRLMGIPNEYFEYCFVAEEETSNGLYDTIIRVCEMPKKELEAFGHKAQQFILQYKNPEYQCGKIFTLLK